MRNFAWLLIPVFLVSASADLAAQVREGATDRQSRNANKKLFEWCVSQFPMDEGESAKPLPRPAEKLRPFELAGALTPPGLVIPTEITGMLPPEIEKYKGQWTWPTHGETPPATVFVERLTPTEMAIAWAFRREKGKDAADYRAQRELLKWTGKSFSSSTSTPEGTETLDIYVSANGQAMFIASGHSRVVTLVDKDGKQSSHTSGEGWPACFISGKHY